MKKFAALLTAAYVVMASSTSAVAPFVLSSLALAEVAAPLAQLLKPIAEESIGKIVKEIHGVLLEQRCPIGCRGPVALPCKTSKGLSVCKGWCQRIRQVGGYELRIRFGENWSLTKCVRNGVASGKNTPKGKGNPKSIAVYSQEDLDHILSLIALQMAARKVASTNGKSLSDRELRRLKIDRKTATADAADLVAQIEKSIQEDVGNGIYGNQ